METMMATLNGWGHAGHHAEFALYVLLVLLILYFPPKGYAHFGAFLERHFGDAVGFYILHLGIALTILGSVWPNLVGVQGTGNSLIFAGMIAMKLRTVASPNGNGTISSSTISSVSTDKGTVVEKDTTTSTVIAAPKPAEPAGG